MVLPGILPPMPPMHGIIPGIPGEGIRTEPFPGKHNFLIGI
jgi:hypothetical protein